MEDPLANANDITERTYTKCNCCFPLRVFPMADVVVNSINVGAGTVNASMGGQPALDYPKEQLFDYINFYNFE